MTHIYELVFEKNRFSTFKNWPFDNSCKCSSKSMAEAGFFHIATADSEPDAVECFYCGKQLDGWEKTDDPWDEHIKHASYCKFAKLRTPEQGQTLNQFLDFTRDSVKSHVHKYFENGIAKLQAESKLKLKEFKKKNDK